MRLPIPRSAGRRTPGNSSPSWNRGRNPEAARHETGLPVRWDAMKPGLHGVRRIHLPFALPFPQRIHLPFSLPFPFIVALAAGAGLRLVAMVGYPGALWFAGDSYVYLGAALRPQPNLSKTTGYSVFLHALEPFHSLTLVAGLRRDAGWRWQNWRAWLAAAVMAVGCAAPVAAYAGWFHSWWGSYTLSRAEGFYLWGRVSSFAECPVIKPPASEQAICPSGTPSSRTPPGDYIWHAPEVHHMANGGPVTAANDALLRDFAIRAVWAQPLSYLHAVLGGLALAVEWPR